MAERTETAQTNHDAVVERLAEELESGNSNVKVADIDEYNTPISINGYIPDISVGILPNGIYEVETDRADDEEQRQAFKYWAQAEDYRSYKGVLAKSMTEWEIFEHVD